MMEMIGSNIATESHGFSAWCDKEKMEEFDKWEPVEKLEPVKMAQNTKKKHQQRKAYARHGGLF